MCVKCCHTPLVSLSDPMIQLNPLHLCHLQENRQVNILLSNNYK